MAAPVAVLYTTYGFRDAKGRTAKTTFLFGGATTAAIQTGTGTGTTDLQAVSNAHVYNVTFKTGADRTYGGTGVYQDVEDKAVLTFFDPQGMLHRFSIPAPKAAIFKADGETVDPAQVDVAALVTFLQGNIYGRTTDTNTLQYLGGFRARRRMQRRLSILIKAPDLVGPAE